MNSEPSQSSQHESEPPERLLRCVRMHLRIGWWSLLGFIVLGVVLETLHGFKQSWYLDPPYETRRLMWRLSHAHGALLSLIHVVFALTLRHVPGWSRHLRSLSSWFLVVAGFFIPLGFFLGGTHFYSGDPGLGILLVPAGAIMLFASIFLLASAATWNG